MLTSAALLCEWKAFTFKVIVVEFLQSPAWQDVDVSSGDAALRAPLFQLPSSGAVPWENSGGIDCADNAPALIASQEAANVSLLV